MTSADTIALLVVAAPVCALVGFVFGCLETRRSYRAGVQNERERWERQR